MPKAVINNPKTNHGALALFSKGGSMATKGKNPFAAFEKSGKDKEPKGMKEGSKKEEAFDRTQMGMKCGGGVKKMARGGGIESKGKTRGKYI